MSGLPARLLLWSFFCVCPFAQAQDRMPPLAAEDLTEAQAASVAELERVRGYGPRGPWIPLLRSPELMIRARAMGDYLRFNSSLPPRLSEFVILMAAREWTQEYEWHAHRDIAIDAGFRALIRQKTSGAPRSEIHLRRTRVRAAPSPRRRNRSATVTPIR